MGARKKANLDVDRTHGLQVASINTPAVGEDLLAHRTLAERLISMLDLALAFGEFLGERLDDLARPLGEPIVAGVFFGDVARFARLLETKLADARDEAGIGFGDDVLTLRLSNGV